MVLPFRSPTAVSTGLELSDRERLDAIIRASLQELSILIPEYDNYRDYYEGEQLLVFGIELFRSIFGDSFDKFHSNWCEVVVDALTDRLEVEGIILENEEQQSETSQSIWNVFRNNDIDEQQEDLHEGFAVEGRAYAIVWPDPELQARIDFQPAQNVIIRYSDDDWRLPVAAIKRWITADGDIRVTVYTPEAVYKFHEGRETPTPTVVRSQTAGTGPGAWSLQELRFPNEPWPLPNPMGIVPVVEFNNRKGSELKNMIPLQDAINYLAVTSLGASAYAAFPQWVMNTSATQPTGGWKNLPGQVWQIPNILDSDGKALPFHMGQFQPGSVTQYRDLVEMFLQHAALTSKTPVRMFFQSDRGGRGDAPSGDSLIIDDEPLLDKVEKRQQRLGNAWMRVAKLVALAANITTVDEFRGETLWKDPRAKHRSSLLAEAKQMFDIGIPLKFIIRKLALTPDETALLEKMIEEAKVEEQAEAEKAFAQEKELKAAGPAPSSTPFGNS